MEATNQPGIQMPKIPQMPQMPIKVLSKFDFKKYWPFLAGGLLVVLAGIGTAWLISGKIMGRVAGSNSAAPGAKVGSKEVGILDPNIKYQDVKGTLREGGIGNEGTHHLEREGGVSQTVYLTSSMIDLDSFVGKKVEIWGETIAAKKAGWLMDVSKIKISD
jgi:hypothetical protein